MQERDWVGEQPLYRRDGRTSASIQDLARPGDELDWAAMAAFLFHQYVPGDATVYRGIKKVAPDMVRRPLRQDPPWGWKVPPAYFARKVKQELLEVTERRVGDADEVAVFLSGGLDSSIITAVVRELQPKRIHTFSVGFPTFSEQHHAQCVSKHLGTVHHEILVTPGMVLDCLDDLVKAFGEPMGDAATICNYILAREAKSYGFDMAFSGDGGDEVFAGYPWHWLGTRLHYPFAMPGVLKAVGRGILGSMPGAGNPHARANILNTRGQVFCQADMWATQAYMEKALSVEEIKALTVLPTEGIMDGLRRPKEMLTLLGKVQAFDMLNILPEKFCMKSAKATTLAGLTEVAPFLDERVVRLAFQMPPRMRLRGRMGKWILRQAFAGVLPDDILTRPKQGFGTPVGAWLADSVFYHKVKQTVCGPPWYRREKVLALMDAVRTDGARDYHEANVIWTLYALAAWQQSCVG